MAEQSISIVFVTKEVAAGEALVVDLDKEKNEDKTQFVYGDRAYFRIYTYPEDMELIITESDGHVSSQGSGESEEEAFIVFKDTSEGSCSKPVSTLISSKWLGNSLGSISIEGTKITASSKGVAVLKLKYKADFRRYALGLSSKGEDTYTVVVYIQGSRKED